MAKKQEGQSVEKSQGNQETLRTDYPLSEKDEVKKAEEQVAKNIEKAQKEKKGTGKKDQ